MGNLIMIIITIIAIAIFIRYVFKAIKNSETLIEKIIDFLLGLVLIVILIIYYIDRYNIPTYMRWSENIDTQNWLDVLGNYTTGIISAIIGASISLFIMRYQIDENNKSIEKRDKDNLRIQNMPLLKYDCIMEKQTNIRLIQLDSVFNEEESVVQSINFAIKNIGLNTTRKTFFKIKSDILKKEHAFDLNNYGIIEKNQQITIPFVIRLKTNKTYYFELTVYYEDLLQNMYEQNILLKYELSSKNDGLNYFFNFTFETKSENQIDELPKESFENV